MLSRILTILQYFNIDTNILYEPPEDTTHILKVQEAPGYIATPIILLQGKWVEKCGFPVGSQISVECFENKLFIFNNQNPT